MKSARSEFPQGRGFGFMGKVQRLFAAACGAAAILLAGCGIRLGVTAPGKSPVLLKIDTGAELLCQDFARCIQDGDFEGLSQTFLGTPQIAVEQSQEELTQRVWDAYVGSIHCRLDGGLYSTNQGLAQDITLEALDLEDLGKQLQKKVPLLLEARIAQAQDIGELYDEHNSYRQEVIDQVLLQALDEILSKNPATRETPLTLRLCRSEGQWYLQPEGDLIRFLSGNMAGA